METVGNFTCDKIKIVTSASDMFNNYNNLKFKRS